MQAEAGGHGYSAGREIRGLSDLLDKTGNIKLVASEAAQNTLTNAQEFHWGDVFMSFKYQNKGGKLFANGRSIEDINDTSEIGGDRMGRVMNALDTMIADNNIDESIVVSEDLGYGRHFIYRYRRGEGNDIEGLAFEYQGTNRELSEAVNQLGKRAINNDGVIPRNSADFSQPLFFDKDNKNDISDLSKAAIDSFQTDERKNEMDSYLDRLKRDTEGYEELKLRRQLQEKELEKQYEEIILKEEDAKVGIANAVYGLISIAEKMIIQEDKRREEVRQEIINPVPAINSRDVGHSAPLNLSAMPNLHDRTERLTDRGNDTGIKLVKDQVLNRTRNEPSQFIDTKYNTELIIEPIIPALIGLSAMIGEIPGDMFTKDPNDKDQRRPIVLEQYTEAYDLDRLVFGDTDMDPNQAEQFFWQEVISMIFQPVGRGIKDDQMLSVRQLEKVVTDKDRDLLMEFIPIVQADKMSENLKQNAEGLKAITNSFQQGLETISELLSNKSDKSQDEPENDEKLQQKIIEITIIKLGNELVQELIQERAYETKIDSLAQLSFLLHAYEDTDSSALLKQLIAVLIYKQIQTIQADKNLFSQNPKLIEIFNKFAKLSPDTDFLDTRFDLLFLALQKIYSIHKQAQFSIEKLQNKSNYSSRMMMFNQFKNRKNIGQKPIVFWTNKTANKLRHYGIIYQYSKGLFVPPSGDDYSPLWRIQDSLFIKCALLLIRPYLCQNRIERKNYEKTNKAVFNYYDVGSIDHRYSSIYFAKSD